MVDLLFYSRRPLRRGGARAYNYRGAFDETKDGKHLRADKRRGRPPTTYDYSIIVVHDPLDIGGFRPDTCFSVMEYTEMKRQCSFTPGTILNVRGTLRVIQRQDGYQVASKYNQNKETI